MNIRTINVLIIIGFLRYDVYLVTVQDDLSQITCVLLLDYQGQTNISLRGYDVRDRHISIVSYYKYRNHHSRMFNKNLKSADLCININKA